MKKRNNKKIYSDENIFEGKMAKFGGGLFGSLLIFFGFLNIFSPKSGVVHSKFGYEVEVSQADSLFSGIFIIFLGVGLLWFFFLRHLLKKK